MVIFLLEGLSRVLLEDFSLCLGGLLGGFRRGRGLDFGYYLYF